ncbi:serine/threonine-protein kinase, partial [Prosthecobacter sp.]|uniref:serine/threonine-protein kinase n=1 Tax=Prosthecobacter sp. TaxID=1965333 RepID=UPI001DBCA91A
MSTASSGSKPSGGWQPPSLEEMQAMLPQYQFEAILGRGGMGAVYKAVQVTLDRKVAIKVLPVDLIDNTDSQFAERFKNEARTMAKMNHPSIVKVFDFGETNTGLLYIVMEFIDGTDVSKMIASQGKLPEDYALSITAHVSDALAYAHKNGIIHRDIKPANILINMEGAVKVADFGLAKANDPGQSGITKTNMAMGTPDFVAPEAFIPGVPLDSRADLYAMGVMLYQMLTGEIPRGIWTLPGKKLGTDPRFDAIITKAMQTDREVRYQSATDLRRDLDTILTLPRAALIAQQQAAAEATA